MNPLRRIFSYLRYYVSASGRHDLHSPFLFQLNEIVFRRDPVWPDHLTVEEIRNKLLKDPSLVPAEDYGAGSKLQQGERRLADIVRHSSKSPRYARLLYRLVRYLAPRQMLELGTAAGISGLYQCLGNPGGKLITLEGNHHLAEVARKTLSACNAVVVSGSFENTLQEVLEKYKSFGYVFIDGNHRKEPVLRYFNQVLPFLAEEAVVVIDDINWSEEMQEAWAALKADPRVRVSLDLYQLGLLFIRPGMSRQDFTIRY